MSSNTRIPSTEVTGLYGMVIRRFSERLLGHMPEQVGVYWHNPKILRFFMGLGQKSQKWHECDEDLKSLAHMAVSSVVGCSWCLDFGYLMAHNSGLDEAKVREVPKWRESDVYTPLERDVLTYAEAMSHTPPTVTDALVERLSEAIGEAALIELTAFIGLTNVTTRMNVALGIQSQGFAASCGLPPLASPSGNVASST